MLRRIALAALILLVLGSGGVYLAYATWIARQVQRLESGSRLAETARGVVEYSMTGGGARTIMMVHGTPGGYDQSARMAEITPPGYRLLAVSRPGYLRTPLSTGESPGEQADAFAALLDSLDIERVNIIGASGGGPSAAQFAARHPDRCESLVMLVALSRPRERRGGDPGWVTRILQGTDFGGWLLWRLMQRNPRALMGPWGSETADLLMADPEKLTSYERLAETSFVLVSRRLPGIRNDSKWFSEMPPIPLSQIEAPTLVVHGGRDRSVPLDHAQHVVDHVAGAQLVVIEDAGHLVTITHPDKTFGPIFEMYERIVEPAS